MITGVGTVAILLIQMFQKWWKVVQINFFLYKSTPIILEIKHNHWLPTIYSFWSDSDLWWPQLRHAEVSLPAANVNQSATCTLHYSFVLCPKKSLYKKIYVLFFMQENNVKHDVAKTILSPCVIKSILLWITHVRENGPLAEEVPFIPLRDTLTESFWALW